jgi:hypothetical protein
MHGSHSFLNLQVTALFPEHKGAKPTKNPFTQEQGIE